VIARVRNCETASLLSCVKLYADPDYRRWLARSMGATRIFTEWIRSSYFHSTVRESRRNKITSQALDWISRNQEICCRVNTSQSLRGVYTDSTEALITCIRTRSCGIINNAPVLPSAVRVVDPQLRTFKLLWHCANKGCNTVVHIITSQQVVNLLRVPKTDQDEY